MDYRYEPTKVDPAFSPLFEHLQAEFGADYQMWGRVEDDERWISAGVVNPTKHLAVLLPLKRGRLTGRKDLATADRAKMRGHLTSNATQDVVL